MSAAEALDRSVGDDGELESIRLPVFHPLALAIERAVRPAPAPVKPCSLLDALTAISLSAEMSGSRRAVIKVGYSLLPRVKPKYRIVIADIISSPDPVEHMKLFVKTLPEHILTMDPTVR